MERLFYNRWVILGGCLLALGVLYAAVTGGFRDAVRTTPAALSDERKAQYEREADEDAMAKAEDESGLIDKTGEEEAVVPAAAPPVAGQVQAPAPGEAAPPAGDNGPEDGAAQ